MNNPILRHLPDNPVYNQAVSWILKFGYSLTEPIKLRFHRLSASDQSNLICPKISIITPTYNRAQILRDRAIPSVLGQTYSNFEFIIVDDGSTDETRNVIESAGDPRIKYHRTSRSRFRYPNKAVYHWFAGPVVALNAGLSLVTGDWIARIDDDDEWTPDHLECLLKFATSSDFEFVSSDLLMVEDGVERIVTPFSDPLDTTGIGATQTWLYRSYLKSFKYNINCWRKSYFRVNDTDLQQRFYLSGVRIGYLSKVTAVIKPRPSEQHIGSRAYLKNSEHYESFYSQKSE